MPEGSDFVDGSSVEWKRVAQVIFGGALLAFYRSIAQFILEVRDAIAGLLGGVSSFYGELVRLVYGLPATVIAGSWASAEEFVAGSGPAGFIVALGIVLATFWIIQRLVVLRG